MAIIMAVLFSTVSIVTNISSKVTVVTVGYVLTEIGRASCRERVEIAVGVVSYEE